MWQNYSRKSRNYATFWLKFFMFISDIKFKIHYIIFKFVDIENEKI